MRRQTSLSLFGKCTRTKSLTHVAIGAKVRRRVRPIGARPLRFGPLEDRRMLAGVVVDLIDNADTGRSNWDNITNKIPIEGELVFYFPEWAGLLRDYTPTTTNVYVNGVGSDTHFGVTPSSSVPISNPVQPVALSHLRQGENLISVTTEYVDVDIETAVEFAVEFGPIPVPPFIGPNGFSIGTSIGTSFDEIVLDGSLTVWIDTVPPSGDGDLHPDSDSGVLGFPGTMTDRITADWVPSFSGVAEANSIVTVAIDGVPAGTTVTAPLDGNDAFPHQNVEGNWRIDTNLPLDDGEHSAVFTFEDVAGNQFSPPDPVLFLVDSQGPRVTGVEINNRGNLYDLFDLKPSIDGPTPLVNSLVVTLSDLPNRTANFLYDAVFAATAADVGHYQVVGDSNGVIPIESVTFTPLPVAAGVPATGYVTINFAEPLPDDRFTLTIADSLVDAAGNSLDGESNASQPIEPPIFPSGDGLPGGDFVARFTVDSRAEIGVWSAGSVYLDINGNFSFDLNNADATNRDLLFTLGYATDHIFAGDFDGSGFDQTAAYGRRPGGFEWLINDDLFAPQPSRATNGAVGIPVAADFNGNPADGDEVGVFTGTQWLFDTSDPKDFQLNTSVASGIRGLPIVGNFDGFGGDDLGTYDPNANTFFLSLDSQGGGIASGALTTVFSVGLGSPFIGVRERPVAGDMDGDGIDDIGLWVPDRSGMTLTEAAEWYFFVSGGQSLTNRIHGDSLTFGPSPFGNDICARFGDEFAIPIVGNFDPPVFQVTANINAAPVSASVDGTSLQLQSTPDENGGGQHPLTLANTDTTTPDANNNVVTSGESSSVTIQGTDLVTGTLSIITTANTETRDADGNVASSSESSSVTTQGADPETGAPWTTTNTSTVVSDADGNVVSSSESSSVTTQGADPETGAPWTTTNTSTVAHDADGNVVSSSESSSVTTQGPDPETGAPWTTTNTSTVTRDASNDVVSSSNSSFMATQDLDPVTGAPLTRTTMNTETHDADGNVVSSSESSSVTTQGADPETGAPWTTTNTSTETRDADGNVVSSSESSSVTTQDADPETGAPWTTTNTSTVVRDADGNVVSSSESSSVTTQGADPETGAPWTTTNTSTVTRDASNDVVSSSNSSFMATQDLDPVTGAPLTRTTMNTETHDADGNVVSSSESSSVTTQGTDPETGAPWTIGDEGTVTLTDPEGGAPDDSPLVRIDLTNANGASAGEPSSPETSSSNPAPPTPTADLTPTVSPMRNAVDPLDVTGDEIISPLDALVVVNYVDSSGPQPVSTGLAAPENSPPYMDVNGDLVISALDIIVVVNFLNNRPRQGAEGEAALADIHTGFFTAAQQTNPGSGIYALQHIVVGVVEYVSMVDSIERHWMGSPSLPVGPPSAEQTLSPEAAHGTCQSYDSRACLAPRTAGLLQVESTSDASVLSGGVEDAIEDIAADVTFMWL